MKYARVIDGEVVGFKSVPYVLPDEGLKKINGVPILRPLTHTHEVFDPETHKLGDPTYNIADDGVEEVRVAIALPNNERKIVLQDKLRQVNIGDLRDMILNLHERIDKLIEILPGMVDTGSVPAATKVLTDEATRVRDLNDLLKTL